MPHNGKMWQYTIATDNMTQIAQHDPARFAPAVAPFTQDEEASGIFDAQSILGAGMFLFVDQAHYGIAAPVVEGGQLLALYNPTTATSNPEINVQGNAINITDGTTATGSSNNTNFGSLAIGTPTSQSFVIQNTGTGTLSVTQIGFSGANASEFTITGSPTYPWSLAPSASKTITVQFLPTAAGTRSANIQIVNTDFSEDWYNFTVDGIGVNTTGLNSFANQNTLISLFPNPSHDEVNVKIVTDANEKVNVTVYDLQGKLVIALKDKQIKKGENTIAINTSDFKTGVYFVEVSSGNKSSKMKLVVSH